MGTNHASNGDGLGGFQEVDISSGYSVCVCVSPCVFLTGLVLSSVMRARVHAHSC